MTDDVKNGAPPDRSRISIYEDHDVAYWTKAFGVTAEQLAAAVRAVGPSSLAVRAHLWK